MGCNFSCINKKSKESKKNIKTIHKKKHNLNKLNNIDLNIMNEDNLNQKNNYTIKKDNLINEDEYYIMKTNNKKIELKYNKIGKFVYKKENKIHFKNIYKLLNENELISPMNSPKMSYINIYEPDGLYSYQKNKQFNKEFWSNISTLKNRVLLKRQKLFK